VQYTVLNNDAGDAKPSAEGDEKKPDAKNATPPAANSGKKE
jgi:hypothetical protein